MVLPAEVTAVGALAVARRLVADSGRGPVELGARWRTERFDVVAALADRLGGAEVTVVFGVLDPGPLLEALAGGAAGPVVASQPRRLFGSDRTDEPPNEAAGYTLRWGGRQGAVVEVSPPLVGPDQLDVERLTAQVARIERLGLLSAAAAEQALARVLRRAWEPWRLPLPDGFEAALGGAAVLWHPSVPVQVVADFADVTDALALVGFGARSMTVTLGGYRLPPMRAELVDVLVEVVAEDALRVDWGCELVDIAGPYNGVRLEVHEDYEVDFEFYRGGVQVEVMLNERHGRHDEILGRIAERSGVTILSSS